VRIANGTALCHRLQLYRSFVSYSSEFCLHNIVVGVYFVIDSVRKLLDTPLVIQQEESSRKTTEVMERRQSNLVRIVTVPYSSFPVSEYSTSGVETIREEKRDDDLTFCELYWLCRVHALTAAPRPLGDFSNMRQKC
jgi:hypothetical protein